MWEWYEKLGSKTKKMGWERFVEKNEKVIERTKRGVYVYGLPMEKVRCPGCGKDGRLVGEDFEASANKDKKRWARLKVASFCHWLSREQEAEKVEERKRLRERKRLKKEWLAEEAKRIEAYARRLKRDLQS